MVIQGYMYILKCSDESYYTGSTKDLDRRLSQHQAGEGANHTRKKLPVELVYFETFSRIDEAFKREKQIQGWSRKKKEALIGQDFEALKKLAECRNGTHYAAGFDSAQPALGSTQNHELGQEDIQHEGTNNVESKTTQSSLSGAEMSGAQTKKQKEHDRK